MEFTPNGETLNLDLDELFKEEDETSTPLVTDEKKAELTAAMTKRINEVKTKTEAEVRDKIAKDLGFENFKAMEEAKTKKVITEAGYDPEDLEKIIKPMIEERLASDPRMQKLQAIDEQEKKTYISSQLTEIEKLTGLKVNEAELSKETLDLWGKGVPLAQAYIAANPTKIISANNRGSTAHLATGSGTGQTKARGYTQAEKDLYKSINPNATDEELNKKTIEVK